jgi:hypothetical protein
MIDQLIKQLELLEHPEGGLFNRIYTAKTICQLDSTNENKPLTSAIHYLLHGHHFSCWHKIQSDELWCLLSHNSDLLIHEIHGENVITAQLHALSPSYTVAANTWFAVELVNKCADSFALSQCVVSPGFDFADFQMACADDLAQLDSELIAKFLKHP